MSVGMAIAETRADTRADKAEIARAETRERILDTADRLFRHYGYSKTTVADIAREMGMSPANVYRFFASKGEINEAMAHRMLGEKIARARHVAQLPLPASQRITILAEGAYRDTIDTMIDDTKVHEMVTVAMEERWPIIAAHIERITELLAGVIAEGIVAGEFPPQDVKRSASCLHQCFISLVHPQLVAQCRNEPSFMPPPEMAKFALRALKHPEID